MSEVKAEGRPKVELQKLTEQIKDTAAPLEVAIALIKAVNALPLDAMQEMEAWIDLVNHFYPLARLDKSYSGNEPPDVREARQLLKASYANLARALPTRITRYLKILDEQHRPISTDKLPVIESLVDIYGRSDGYFLWCEPRDREYIAEFLKNLDWHLSLSKSEDLATKDGEAALQKKVLNAMIQCCQWDFLRQRGRLSLIPQLFAILDPTATKKLQWHGWDKLIDNGGPGFIDNRMTTHNLNAYEKHQVQEDVTLLLATAGKALGSQYHILPGTEQREAALTLLQFLASAVFNNTF